MEQEMQTELENQRYKKIIELGYLCYNMAIDKKQLSQDIVECLLKIKKCYDLFYQEVKRNSDRSIVEEHSKNLEQAAVNTGCACYNAYIDKRIYDETILTICKDISKLNIKILDEAMQKNNMNHESVIDTGENKEEWENTEEHKVVKNQFENGYSGYKEQEYKQTNTQSQINNKRVSDDETAKRQFKMNYPFGMEPIPDHYIKCKCGYRNRSIANFCGKCGAKL